MIVMNLNMEYVEYIWKNKEIRNYGYIYKMSIFIWIF
jgi:hypothetical protein